MPTVKVHTPDTEQKAIPAGIAAMTQKADAEVHVQDDTHRVLTLKKPHFIAQFRLADSLGEVTDRYMNMVAPILYLTAIDGDPVYPPRSKDEVEVILQRLDAHGYAALSQGIAKNFVSTEKNEAMERDTVKK